jgi:hypothetical protein
MNANRIAPIAGSTWFWRGIAALEALLLAAAVAIGLAGRLPVAIAPSPVAAPAARVSAPATVQKGLIACKPCREEVLAAAQAQLSAPVAFAAREPVARPGASRTQATPLDPAAQSVLDYLRAHSADQPSSAEQQVDRRGAGPR